MIRIAVTNKPTTGVVASVAAPLTLSGRGSYMLMASPSLHGWRSGAGDLLRLASADCLCGHWRADSVIITVAMAIIDERILELAGFALLLVPGRILTGGQAATAQTETDRLTDNTDRAPILADKHYESPSVFTPQSLLREARRQKGTGIASVPAVCLLDPDGDVVRQLKADGRSRRHDGWVCYHTEFFVFECGGLTMGVVGCAVGASFAVLVAEELFACGCALLISVTSSGQITPARTPPYFILIDRAWRDEGTSYHYRPPSPWSEAPGGVIGLLDGAFADTGIDVVAGASRTTDAPFRETQEAIARMRWRGIFAVEMEAAALYAFAQARQRPVICFAHVTNQMGQIEGDFEKGEENGTAQALALARRTATQLGFA